MSSTLKICFAASEVAPFAKTGGLADVAGALPLTLRQYGLDVRLFMPLYTRMQVRDLSLTAVEAVQQVPVQLGTHQLQFSLFAGTLPQSTLPIYMVDCPALYARDTLYTQDADEPIRFLLLQHAIAIACQRLQFAPDIMHCNDWHMGLLPLLLRSTYAQSPAFAATRSLLSIHNIGYQGVFAASTAAAVNLQGAALHAGNLAAGYVNWLQEGIMHADTVATVSPNYALEICTPTGGHGLDVALRARGDTIVGILNGVDYSYWNPEHDPYLRHHYTAQDLSGKAQCKLELIERLQLKCAVHTPLMGLVSRLVEQKGIDLLRTSLAPLLSTRKVALVVLGSGESRYETFFTELQQQFPQQVHFNCGYDEGLAHLIEAGSDIFLMPSLYEPCGLNQLYSLKYGTVPVVRRTGGLADSVQMWDPTTATGTGVVFNDYDVPAMQWAFNTVLDLYQDTPSWQQLMLNGMRQDYSWDQQARHYVQLYQQMAQRPSSKRLS